ncbi:hypothetical protein [Brevibacterium album]|uniref:hypothetical protein n=1 Tax=Brevibacterium album TaxID=417948 RepID=UPI0003FC6A6B|nr:hypothetical protein [Brevibacterium album]
MIDVLREVSWKVDSIVPPLDCETCGPSRDNLSITLYSGRELDCSINTGCYGGNYELVYDLDSFIEWLDHNAEGFISDEDRLELIAQVEAEWEAGAFSDAMPAFSQPIGFQANVVGDR